MPSREKRVTEMAGSPLDPESGTSSLSLDRDVAIKLVGEHAQEIDPEMERKVLRKIDLFLIPAMIIGTSSLKFSSVCLARIFIPSWKHQVQHFVLYIREPQSI